MFRPIFKGRGPNILKKFQKTYKSPLSRSHPTPHFYRLKAGPIGWRLQGMPSDPASANRSEWWGGGGCCGVGWGAAEGDLFGFVDRFLIFVFGSAAFRNQTKLSGDILARRDGRTWLPPRFFYIGKCRETHFLFFEVPARTMCFVL